MYGTIIIILNNKLISLKPAIAAGKISLGKYTCWMRDEFWIRQVEQLLNVLENELNITDKELIKNVD